MTLHDLITVVLISAAVGFGLRLGRELYPTVEKAVAYVLAVPVWLVMIVAHRIRRALRGG